MSIASEITRLQGVKADILTAIADKGVTVPAGSALDDCPDLIASISGGGGGSYPQPIIDPSVKTHLYIETGSTSSVGVISGPSLELDNTIEFTFSPSTDIKSSDYTGAYGDIASLLLIGNGASGTSGIKIGYYFGSIAIMASWSGYTPNFSVGDLLQDNLYNLIIKNDRIIFNQTEHAISGFSKSWNYFQYPNISNATPIGIKFYELKFSDANGIPSCRFIPAKKNNVNGLYECYSGNFYNCNGTTILGPEMPL